LLVGEALSGALIIFAVVLLFGRERLRGVRRSLVERVHNQGGELR
jgi:Sec-independent protein translocase protein TatA